MKRQHIAAMETPSASLFVVGTTPDGLVLLPYGREVARLRFHAVAEAVSAFPMQHPGRLAMPTSSATRSR
jgi:hypothetical protein